MTPPSGMLYVFSLSELRICHPDHFNLTHIAFFPNVHDDQSQPPDHRAVLCCQPCADAIGNGIVPHENPIPTNPKTKKEIDQWPDPAASTAKSETSPNAKR